MADPSPSLDSAGLLRRQLLAGGLPLWEPSDVRELELRVRARRATEVPRRFSGTVALTLCTRSHLPLARVTTAGLRRHAPELTICAVVVDAEPGEALDLPGVEVVAGSELGDPRLGWLALKFLPIELCCSLKPRAVLFALEAGAERVLWVDSDIEILAPPASLLEPLETHDWVVVPHARRQLDPTEAPGHIPAAGDLTLCGMLNGGLFAVRRSDDSLRYIARWADWASGPEAFLGSWWGGLTDQQLFVWVISCGGRVRVLDDVTQNVAYWNLHERSVRVERGAGGTRFTVEGRPLASFHWSGFDPADRTRLSAYDSRHSPLDDPALAELADAYRERLAEAGWRAGARPPWRWSHLPSGVEVTPAMRELFRRHERFLDRGDDPWSREGERRILRSLLEPLPATGSLVPLILLDAYLVRPDLRWAFPEAPTAPQRFFRWWARHGVHELGYAELLDRARPVTVTPGIDALVAALEPEIAAGEEPFGAGRRRAAEGLRSRGERALAEQLEESQLEIYGATTLSVVRTIWSDRGDLRAAFPDPLGEDCAAFAAWIEGAGRSEYLLAPTVAAALRHAGDDRALARIFTRLSVDWERQRRFPLALLGEGIDGFAAELLQIAAVEPVLEPDDVVALLWILESAPSRTLRWLFELPIHLHARPSTDTAEGRLRLLEPLLARHPMLGRALHEYEAERAGSAAAWPLDGDEGDEPAARLVIERLEHLPAASAPPSARRGRGSGLRRGVHLFGGLGLSGASGKVTAALRPALAELGVPILEGALLGAADGAEPDAEALLRSDPTLDTLLMVFRADRPELPLERWPRHRRRGRRAIACLIWEPRVVKPFAREIFEGFEEVWAPTRAAAATLEEALGRSVAVVAPALDPALLGQRGASPPRFEPERAHVLATLDVLEPLDRQHLSGTVEAFRRAFADGRPATLWLRVVGRAIGSRLERLRRFRAEQPPGLDLRLVEAHRLPWGDVASCAAYVSLDRAAPDGCELAGAIAAGLPVVASRAAAHLDLLDAGDAALIETREIEVQRTSGPFRRGASWDDADLDRAAARLRAAVDDAADARRHAELRRARLLEERSPAATASRLRTLLGWS